jgi:hypothetical protein
MEIEKKSVLNSYKHFNYRAGQQQRLFLKTAIVISMQIILLCTVTTIAPACIGNVVVIGTSDTSLNRLAAELVMQFITERTGTTTKIIFHRTGHQLEESITAVDDSDRIDILLTNSLSTQWGMDFLREDKDDGKPPTFILKKDTMDFGQWLTPDPIWLQTDSAYFILIRKDLLDDFPLLPRLLNKLAITLDNAEFAGLVDLVEAGEKAKNIARKVLKQKGLI